jgi:inner membrane protein
MASVGHIAVGMAGARAYHDGRLPRWSSLVWWSALSLLPDVDTIGFAFGVPYAAPWGHRGATHSLTLSLVLGLLVGLAARWRRLPAISTAFTASAVLASHGLLDTMTDGGLGCALLWPFDLTRYFAPWRPIPVAPIGPSFFSPYGAMVAATELVLFSPLLVFALRSWRARTRPVVAGCLLAVWLGSGWLLTSGDPAREALVGFVLREDTAYSNGFTEHAFRSIREGASDAEVRRLLGVPYGEGWIYQPKGQPFRPAMDRSAASLPPECLLVRSEAGVVVAARDAGACATIGVHKGVSLADVNQRLGPPPEWCWEYAWGRDTGHHRIRMLCFTNARVTVVIRQWS